MGWIRTEYDFGSPVLQLLVSEANASGRELLRLLNAGKDAPMEELAAPLTAFVEKWRPDLRGAALVGVRLRQWGMWEMTVVHPSVKRTATGEMCSQEELETNAQRMAGLKTGPSSECSCTSLLAGHDAACPMARKE